MHILPVFVSKCWFWLTRQGEHVRDAALWISRLPHLLSTLIAEAWNATLSWLGLVLMLIGKGLMIGAIIYLAILFIFTAWHIASWVSRRSTTYTWYGPHTR